MPEEAEAQPRLEFLGDEMGPARARDVAPGGAEVGHARHERVGERDDGSVLGEGEGKATGGFWCGGEQEEEDGDEGDCA